MRIGILGGSFDPIHYGHLLLAEASRETLDLQQVLFIPAAAPPHRVAKILSPPADRLEMLRLAVADHRPFQVESLELDRGGFSFTYETLEALQARWPEAELVLILGADSLHDLPQWVKPERICELATLACALRPQAPPLDFSRLAPFVSAERLERFRQSTIPLTQMDLSSSDIRARVRSGRSIRFRVPRSVEKYIETHRLYRAMSDATAAATE